MATQSNVKICDDCKERIAKTECLLCGKDLCHDKCVNVFSFMIGRHPGDRSAALKGVFEPDPISSVYSNSKNSISKPYIPWTSLSGDLCNKCYMYLTTLPQEKWKNTQDLIHKTIWPHLKKERLADAL